MSFSTYEFEMVTAVKIGVKFLKNPDQIRFWCDKWQNYQKKWFL